MLSTNRGEAHERGHLLDRRHRRNAPDPPAAVSRPARRPAGSRRTSAPAGGEPVETHTIVTGGAVVTVTWDADGRLHVRVGIDGIPDSRLIDGAVPLDISVDDEQVFPPVSDDDSWDDEL
jgi:hypothetical protein